MSSMHLAPRMLTFGGGDNSDAFHDSVFSLEDSTWTDISTSGTGLPA